MKCIICSRNEDKLEVALDQLKSIKDAEVFSFKADLTKKNDTNKLVNFCESKFKKIDILVLNTGHPPTDYFSNLSETDWDNGINLILKPFIRLTNYFLPKMKENNFGRLFFIGSIFGLEPEASSVIQSTLRGGLNSLSKCIATEVGENYITSNVICPGYFDTPLLKSVAVN